jgi:hypothetical protein
MTPNSAKDVAPAERVLPLVIALSVCIGGCGTCEPDKTATTQSTPSSSASSAAGTTVPSPIATSQRQAPLLCRVLAIEGDVRVDSGAALTDASTGSALATRSEIPHLAWLSLAPNARLVAKDPRSARETLFRGPGRARVCVDFLEESWVAAGTFESAVGTGDAPGAEEWVVTPLGVVRFGGGKVRIEVLGRRVRMSVGPGVLFVWTARDAFARSGDGGMARTVDDGWARLADGDATLSASALQPPLEAARDARDACSQLARSARDLTSVLLGGDADSATAVRQVTGRRLARAACAVAGLRSDLLSASDAPSVVRSGLAASLSEAAALWRSLPSETSTQR